MNRFRTVREAKEYLVGRILAQADQDGVSLSDIERKMLYFSETGWTLPDIMAVSQEFDQLYEQDNYERKIGQIVRRLRKHLDTGDDGSWDEAVDRLRDEDHYLLVLIGGDFGKPGKLSRWEIFKLILAGAVVVAIMLPTIAFLDSHIADQTISNLIGGGVVMALVVLVTIVANRGSRNSA